MHKIVFKESARKLLLVVIPLAALAIFWSQNRNFGPKPNDQNQLAQILSARNYQEFETFTQKNTPAKTYTFLKEAFPKNEPEAHDFAHIIGIVTNQQSGLNGLATCDILFNYGCFHGFMESFLTKNGISGVSQIETSCITLGQVHAPSCLHGIGHGVMVDTSYDLDKALANCRFLQESSRIYCWDGVFMERNIASMQSDKSQVLDETDLQKPCNRLRATYQNQCFRNQVFLWYNHFSGDNKNTGRECSQIPQEYWEQCFEAIGFQNVMVTPHNQQELASRCQNIQETTGADFCLSGTIKELLFEGKDPALAGSLCSYVSPPFAPTCQNTFTQHYSQYQTRFLGY